MPPKYQEWVDARNRNYLSHAHIQMARETGLNPKKLGKLVNHKQEPWKVPLPEYIEELYFKHYKKRSPENVISIEQLVKLKAPKKNREKENQEARKSQ
ncbi:MAG: hypothetical protein JW927_04590 [Deltaproteobacteria bacterium]|nr:hypothetical protein [Deltaproteobacteria bacterium]